MHVGIRGSVNDHEDIVADEQLVSLESKHTYVRGGENRPAATFVRRLASQSAEHWKLIRHETRRIDQGNMEDVVRDVLLRAERTISWILRND